MFESISFIRHETQLFTCLVTCCAFATSCTITPVRMVIQTTSGPIQEKQAGLILPHEHIFTDLRGPTVPGYGQDNVENVVRIMKPFLSEAKAKGIGILVECSSIGVGRNVPILQRMTQETGLAIVVPTGVYGRGIYLPAEYEAMTEDQLSDWMICEIVNGIDRTCVKAGFIKVACDDTPLTEFQQRQLRAAARASLQTGAAIASHTPSGPRAIDQAKLLKNAGLPLDRFIWVHAQAEANLAIHAQLAAWGVYIEYDSVGSGQPKDSDYIRMIQSLDVAGYADRILLSHDAGWYQPGSPNGGTPKGYTYLYEKFIPALRAAGAEDKLVRRLTIENPWHAYAMPTETPSTKIRHQSPE